jgi:hypothetical protein
MFFINNINLGKILSNKNLKLIYYAFVQSILQHGIIGWGSAGRKC